MRLMTKMIHDKEARMRRFLFMELTPFGRTAMDALYSSTLGS
jgi:hypothetical protein